MTTDRTRFGAETTTDEVLEGIDLAGRTAFVTGASGGLGAETGRALASKGAAVTLAARNVAKAEEVAAGIRSSTGNDAVDVVELDLTSLESVRRCAEGWLADHDRLDLLINNAGVMATPFERTDHGWELQLATNHLGHFLLTALLLPALRKGAPSRVVNLSSGGHRMGGVEFDDLHFERRDYDKWTAYGQSKTANVLFSVELDARGADAGIRSLAVHPGVIMTELARYLQPEDIQELMGKSRGAGLTMKPVEAGAATSVWAATAPELGGRGGLYLEDCHVADRVDEEGAGHGVSSHALDRDDAQRLWSVSEELVGQKFQI